MKEKYLGFRKTFSDEIYSRRKQRNLSQQSVADAVKIGLRWYQMLETGLYMPSAIVIVRLMILLDINPQIFANEVELNATNTIQHS